MSEREKILERVREALTISAPAPGHHHEPAPGQEPHPAAPAEFKEWLPAVGETLEDRIALFARNSDALKTEFIVLESKAALPAKLAELAQREGWKKVASHKGELTDLACSGVGLPVVLTDHGYEVSDMETSDAGISGCDLLVAQTGSVVVTSRSAGGRALSVLPPHHVVVASKSQIVPDLPTAFAVLEDKYSPDYPSFLSFITGPSRTGDIERILVLGAHGPKKLTVLLVKE